MRYAIRISLVLGIALLAASAFLAEGALHVWNQHNAAPGEADALARQGAATWKPVRLSVDGAQLEAWLFTPARPNGAAVILMHGVADTRTGMSGHAPFLLRAGYTVLMPDSRGHGASGSGIITYGLREAGDIHRWADLLIAQPGVERLYGLGQSMGAAILLEALPREPRFRALVADCSFATFEEIACDRLGQHGIRSRAVSWPVVGLGFTYARLRYGIDLWHASPAESLRAARTPVLLIHGLADTNILPRHSRELHAANPALTELWEVPRAGHVDALSTAPAEYQSRVLAWFGAHR